MTNRTYGVIRAAGTQIQEQEADKTIEGAIFGVTGYAGILEHGPVNKLISTFSKADFARKCGGRIAESTLPDVCQDFWEHSKGNGELHLARLDDGTGVQAQRKLYLRRLVAGKLRIPLATVKAANVGKWGGKRNVLGKNVGVVIGDYTSTTLTTGITMLLNEWKDATLVLDAVAGKSYHVIGNTTAGVLTIDSDQNLLTDLGTPPPADLGWNLFKTNGGDAVAFETGIDDQDPTNYFWLKVYVDGNVVKTFDHLSIDPASARYYKNIITDSDDNFEIEITNLWTGGVAADVKSGFTGYVTTLGTGGKILNVQPYFTEITSPTSANPVIALGVPTAAMEWEDLITITVLAGALTASVVSAHWGNLGLLTLGAALTPNTPYLPSITVTNGATILVVGDVIQIEWVPLIPNALKNGTLIPKLAAPSFRYNIVSNTVNSVSVAQDMTGSGVAPADQWMIVSPQEMAGGYDGIWGLTDADYIAKFDTATSPFNSLRNKNKGQVKLATPGKTTVDVQRAGQSYAEFNAYEWRTEVPSATTTEQGAIDFINNTLGRNDFTVVEFPSFAYVTDPDKPDQLKLIPQTGAIHGTEAKIASDYFGYHRAEAGTIAALPRVKKLTTAKEELDEERLNPAGIGVLKKVGATFYIWGDRTISLASDWQWKHQREQANHYINILRENFPWAIFDINDVLSDMPVLTALTDYFAKEYEKRALNRDFPFKEACVIKMDGSVNTPTSRALGDKIATIALMYANVTERLILKISKQGIHESIG